jgi:hypothetical protein
LYFDRTDDREKAVKLPRRMLVQLVDTLPAVLRIANAQACPSWPVRPVASWPPGAIDPFACRIVKAN